MSQFLLVAVAGINSNVITNRLSYLFRSLVQKRKIFFSRFRYHTLQVEEKQSLTLIVSRVGRDSGLKLEEKHTIHEKFLSFGIVYSRSYSRHNLAVVFENLERECE
jgi:hypothetical protein